MKETTHDFRLGVLDIAPVLVAATPIGLLWGTLAAGKGLSPLEAGLFSGSVFAGAAQFVALEVWRDPVPWIMLTVTAFIVNVRHVLMGASLSRHMSGINRRCFPFMMFLMVDESWAFSERRAQSKPLTLAYYLGLCMPMWVAWTSSSVAGAMIGRSFGDPTAVGLDFAFSALFIGLIAGFWRGSRTGAVLVASAAAAAIIKIYVPGAWYIVIGGLAGVAVAAALHGREAT